MNKPLKFRVWDKYHKQWIGACAIELDGTIIDIHNAIPDTNWIAQQYTGLKDKNGKEIYEGDIVKWGGLNYLVEWNDVSYKWQGRCPYYNTYHHPTTENFRDLMNGVIVGNIVENPELCNIKQTYRKPHKEKYIKAICELYSDGKLDSKTTHIITNKLDKL